MGFIDKYPYTDFHELNLDWILKTIRELGIKMDEFEAVNTITFSGAWDITKQYPAWTVVSDNNIGYISIQPVPVGIVLTNTDYWRVIVDYSAQIAGMQTDIINLQNTVGDASSGLVKQTNDNTAAISANTASINNINAELATGKWLFIGDSYQNYGDWYSKILARLGLTDGTDAFYCGGSGHGFTVSGGEWVTDFNTFCTGRTDLDKFKHIIFVGGLNDSGPSALASDAAALRTAIRAFFSAAWANMVNTEICFAYVGSALSDSAYLQGRTADNRFTAMTVIKQEFLIQRTSRLNVRGRYFEGPQYALHSPGFFVSDGVHPNSYGIDYIVRSVVEAIVNRGSSVVYANYEETNTMNFGSGNFTCYDGFVATMNNSRSRIVMRTVVDQNSPNAYTIGTTPVDLGRIPVGLPIYNSNKVDTFVQRSNSGAMANMFATLWIEDGHLFVMSNKLKAGPAYDTLTISVGDRVDFGNLTFDEFTLFTL